MYLQNVDTYCMYVRTYIYIYTHTHRIYAPYTVYHVGILVFMWSLGETEVQKGKTQPRQGAWASVLLAVAFPVQHLVVRTKREQDAKLEGTDQGLHERFQKRFQNQGHPIWTQNDRISQYEPLIDRNSQMARSSEHPTWT